MARSPRHQKVDAADEAAAHGVGTRTVVVALLTSVVAAAAKLAGFAVSGSTSLLAAGAQSVADALDQAVLLVGGRRATRTAAEQHPLGTARDHYFWGFLLGMALSAAAAAVAIVAGMRALDDPEVLTDQTWALGGLGVAAVVQLVALRTALVRTSDAKGTATTRDVLRHATAPALPAVALQAVGAMAGTVLAAAGVGATIATDDGRWDGYGSLAVGAAAALVAIAMAVEMKALLAGAGATRREVEAIRAAVEIDPNVVQLVHLRAVHLGPGEVLVSARVQFQADLEVAEVAATIDRLERTIRAGIPAAKVTYLEPALEAGDEAIGFVATHEGHIDPDDPRYRDITGIRVDDDIWTEG